MEFNTVLGYLQYHTAREKQYQYAYEQSTYRYRMDVFADKFFTTKLCTKLKGTHMLDETVAGNTPETFLYDLRQESNLRAYDIRCTTALVAMLDFCQMT